MEEQNKPKLYEKVVERLSVLRATRKLYKDLGYWLLEDPKTGRPLLVDGTISDSVLGVSEVYVSKGYTQSLPKGTAPDKNPLSTDAGSAGMSNPILTDITGYYRLGDFRGYGPSITDKFPEEKK